MSTPFLHSGGSSWGPVFQVLLIRSLGFWLIWARCALVGGQRRAGVRIVPHIGSVDPSPTLLQLQCETQGSVTDP